ncbi:hypothetical protein [Streptomyces sp. NPDC059176]|uniref:hypothetical protein n=1 Tax=unclassified Streptomyces TaxID=2593676 RepID=UPI00368507E9
MPARSAARNSYGLRRLCTILDISRSSFACWRRAPARADRQAAGNRLATRVRAVHRESDDACGVPRVTAEVRERVCHQRIARDVRSLGLAGLRLRCRHRTTTTRSRQRPRTRSAATASEPNTKYVGDSPISRRMAGSCSIWPP